MISDIKRRALHRSKILQGQLKGLEKMIDKEEYCMDIITQSLAIQRSMGSLNKLILENHLKTHAAHQLGSKDEKVKADTVNELLSLYDLSNVKSK
jgi:DNA-binding FrmR family transcriptional regulator